MEQDPAEPFYRQLVDSQEGIGLRYQAVFQLKNIATGTAIGKLVQAYPLLAGSVLLSHEVLYTLGQLDPAHLPLIKDLLVSTVDNDNENSLSRHEAAQALANYFLPQLQQLYKKHLGSKCNQLRWTCQIALEKVKRVELRDEYGKLYASTKQPAAPYSQEEFTLFLEEQKLTELFEKKGFLGLLLRPELPLFNKYRIMYLMRNDNNDNSKQVLSLLLSKQHSQTQTSLLKHEVCFILGQIGCENYEHLVRECIENEEEESIVRHEALAAVASQSKDDKYLYKFVDHADGLIRESALVAQFQIHYWND